MTPFGNFIESRRRSRRLRQSDLAEMIGVNPSYISSIESGRKGPPSKALLLKIIEALSLSSEEVTNLYLSVEQSQRVIRLPENTSAEECRVLSSFVNRLGSLSREELTIIGNLLVLGEKTAREVTL